MIGPKGPGCFHAGTTRVLLRFAVRLVLPAIRTKLFQFQPLSSGSLILRLAVVPVLTFSALELDNFTRHLIRPSFPKMM
jgi:hypothetical protein